MTKIAEIRIKLSDINHQGSETYENIFKLQGNTEMIPIIKNIKALFKIETDGKY